MFVKRIYETVLRRKIAVVNRHLEAIRFQDSAIQSMYGYAVHKSGKRFRPLLVMLSCEAVGGDSGKVVPIACAFELLHKASLIHDDLIDGDDFRRGVATFHRKYSKEKAIVMGDLLIAVAFDQLFRCRRELGERFSECYETLIDTFRVLSMGELKEELLRETTAVNSADVEKLHYQKTAVLIESCFKVGAIAGGGSLDEVQALARFGKNVGLIFQTVNDINNIDGLESKVKHKLYTDIASKRKNHVLVHALQTAKERKELRELLSKDSLTGDDVERILSIIKDNRSLQYAYGAIDGYIADARESIVFLRRSTTKMLMEKLLDEAKGKWFWHSK